MLIFYIIYGAGSHLLFVAAASLIPGQANRFSVSALASYCEQWTIFPIPTYFIKDILMPLICHHPAGPEASVKVPGRGNLDHEQFVTSSISNTLRTKTDL